MSHLGGGDTYFNTWRVPFVPFAQLVKCSKASFAKMFDAMIAKSEYNEDCDDQMTTDEFSLGDEVIPFPHEHNMLFGSQLVETFKADILVLVHTGAGEMIKGALAKQRLSLGICATAQQKNMVMTNLRSWVKGMNLVSFAGAPAKPQSLINYEKSVAKAGVPAKPATHVFEPNTATIPPQVITSAASAVTKAVIPKPVIPTPVNVAAIPKPGTAPLISTPVTNATPQVISPSVPKATLSPKLLTFGSSLL